MGKTISIFHGCMVWIEKSVTRVTDRHHEAFRQAVKHAPENNIHFHSEISAVGMFLFLKSENWKSFI